MRDDMIIVTDYCDKCHIEPSFIDLLESWDLIGTQMADGERCLPFSQLPDVERYSRMYYDLDINIEGIDAIHHLLEQMREMQCEIDNLRSRLRFFGEDF